MALGALAGAGLGASIALPAMGEARQTARRTVSMANLKNIGMAAHIYANDHDGKFPPSLDALREADFVTQQTLQSPLDSSPGVSYIYVGGQDETSDARNVLAYERLYPGSTRTNVLYFDGHVQHIEIDRFKQELADTYRRLGREDEMPDDLRP
jgi:prepilin-type processing-associated H-X9-DG protein